MSIKYTHQVSLALCRDSVFRPGTRPILGGRDRHERVDETCTRDRAFYPCVATGFPCMLGGLGRDKGFLYHNRDFWPCVAT